MPKHLTTTIDRVSLWISLGLVLFLPLFFLPITTEFYDFQKNALLFSVTAILLVLLLARMMAERTVRLVFSPVLLPLAVFTLSLVISLIFAGSNKLEPLITPGSAGTVLILFFLLTILTNLHHGKKREQLFLYALAASASILGLLALLSFVGILAYLPLPEFIKLPTFTPMGTQLSLATFLAVILVAIGGKLVNMLGLDENSQETDIIDQITAAWSSTQTQNRFHSYELFGLGAAFLIVLAGLGVSAYQLTTSHKANLLAPQFGWQIAVETLKSWPTAVVGVGPTNFLSAYTRFRPLSINATDAWNMRFSDSSNAYFHYMTVSGLLGLGGFIFILFNMFKLYKRLSRSEKNADSYLPLFYGIFAIFIITAVVPINFSLLFLLFLFIALVGMRMTPSFVVEEPSLITPVLLVLIILCLVGVGGYFGSQFYLADVSFRRSLTSAIANRGLDVYNEQKEAIDLNPRSDLYRATFAQTNLALATSLARRANATGSGQLTDNERQTVSTLIQQAIAEGKAAVALSPEKVTNWENLGQIYRSLINIADGSQIWTTQVYQQAIELDPVNPLLRLNLGSVYFALGQYDDAARQFELAALLKANDTNILYNLAVAYREKKDYIRANQVMQAVLVNLPANAPERSRVNQELEDIRSKLPPAPKAQSVESGQPLITPPEPAPTGLKQPIQLPKEAEPPEVTAKPKRTATPTPTPHL